MKRRKTIDDGELIIVSLSLTSAQYQLAELAKKYMKVKSKDADYILKVIKNLAFVETFLNETCGYKDIKP